MQGEIRAGRLEEAHRTLGLRRSSVWSSLPERKSLWGVVDRCAELAAALTTWDERATAASPDLTAVAHAYTADDGLWRVDLKYRIMEQAAAGCADESEVSPLLAWLRKRVRSTVDAAQALFLAGVERSGWPPPGVPGQAETFGRMVAPSVQAGRKVVLFLVDAMRYEMGRDLGKSLAPYGTVHVEASAVCLPAITPVGMAALMPGANATLELAARGGELTPCVAGRDMPDSAARMAYLRDQFGDRFAELILGQALSPGDLGARLGTADLVVVRCQEMDELGEGQSLYSARSRISAILGDVASATQRLRALGFQHFVYASDHGHVLLLEAPAGDTVCAPPGEWLMKKRRCRMGSLATAAPGCLVFPPEKLGIRAPVKDVVFPKGFRTFVAGEGYFHEGLSLQECVVPIVVLDALPLAPVPGRGARVTLTYRSDRFTSSIIQVKARCVGQPGADLVVRVQVFDGPGPQAAVIGDVVDCDEWDPTTGLVRLSPGKEVAVSLRLESQRPSIEIRAMDPAAGVILHRLTLRNSAMDSPFE